MYSRCRFIFVLLIGFFYLIALPLVAGEGVSPATMENYKKVKELVEKLPQTKAARYAKEVVEQAEKGISQAQEGLKIGDDTMTKQAVELTKVLITLADVLSDERESREKTESVRKELKKEEERLANILAGKGDIK